MCGVGVSNTHGVLERGIAADRHNNSGCWLARSSSGASHARDLRSQSHGRFGHGAAGNGIEQCLERVVGTGYGVIAEVTDLGGDAARCHQLPIAACAGVDHSTAHAILYHCGLRKGEFGGVKRRVNDGFGHAAFGFGAGIQKNTVALASIDSGSRQQRGGFFLSSLLAEGKSL